MSNEYDYDGQNRQEDDHQEMGGSVPQQPDGINPQQNSGSYHYSGSTIPGGQESYRAGNPDPGYGYQSPNPNGNQVPNQNPNFNPNYNPGFNPNPNPNPNPMASYNVTPRQVEKKSGGGKRIIAVALVCALIGGLGGGAAVGMALKSSVSTAEPVEDNDSTLEEPSVEEEPEAAGAFNNTVIDVTTNSQTTEMTPQDVYEHYVNAVVAISNEGTTTNVFGQVSPTASSGSGFIISEDGYIVTNNHVVSGAETLTVTMTSGDEYEAEIIGSDAENDVALIKIDATGLPTVSIGDSDSIEVGQQVCAIGNPLGELTNTLTVGYVSALDREINENGTPINMFQTDCAINSGNSGGPIFDMHGNVIGITTAKYSSSGSYGSTASIEGIGFCIPANDAMDIVSDLLQYGYVKGRPALGITCQAISTTVTQYYNLPAGIYINGVEAGSAADNAGLVEGDIITALDGHEITSVTEFKALLKQYSAGDSATLTIYRGSTTETMDVDVTFDEKNSQTAASSAPQEQQNEVPDFSDDDLS